MANYKGGATTICPYYLKEAEKSITCMSNIKDCDHMQRFGTKQIKEEWQEKICSTHNYIMCPIASIIINQEDEIAIPQQILASDKDIYNFIIAYTTKNLKSPTVREICNATFYNSTNTVYKKLKKLEDMGLIELEKGKKRNIKLKGYQLTLKN